MTGLGKLFRKNYIKKLKKQKIEPNMPHVNKKKHLANSYPIFSLYLKLRMKNVTPQNYSPFGSTSGFGVPKSSLQIDFKIHEWVNRS